jgi:3-dehydroquinate dehydratase-2
MTDMTATIRVINGPNLNLLGTREPEIYGRETLSDIEAKLRARAGALDLALDFLQSNAEGQIIDWIHEARAKADALILNAGAYTHSSIAILDALSALSIPVIEVHLSNIYRRESFRHQSYVAKAALGSICGFGSDGYVMALDYLAKRLAA